MTSLLFFITGVFVSVVVMMIFNQSPQLVAWRKRLAERLRPGKHKEVA